MNVLESLNHEIARLTERRDQVAAAVEREKQALVACDRLNWKMPKDCRFNPKAIIESSRYPGNHPSVEVDVPKQEMDSVGCFTFALALVHAACQLEGIPENLGILENTTAEHEKLLARKYLIKIITLTGK